MSSGMQARDESDVVFNVVWTGSVFDHLGFFVASQLHHTTASFRFLLNGCDEGQADRIQRFARAHGDRVAVETVSDTKMVPHGACLDAALESGDEPIVGLIDPDIIMSGSAVRDLLALMTDGVVAVSSGQGIWSDTTTIPDDHPGVNGEYFLTPGGFLFGSPHFCLYRRDALVETTARWKIGFGSGGNTLTETDRDQLRAVGADYWLYDTGKLVNAFLQIDGGTMVHREHDGLLHIGGMSHYLSPPAHVIREEGGEPEPDWARWKGMENRFEVARFSAAIVSAVTADREAPQVPDTLSPHIQAKLATVRTAIVETAARFGPDGLGGGRRDG